MRVDFLFHIIIWLLTLQECSWGERQSWNFPCAELSKISAKIQANIFCRGIASERESKLSELCFPFLSFSLMSSHLESSSLPFLWMNPSLFLVHPHSLPYHSNQPPATTFCLRNPLILFGADTTQFAGVLGDGYAWNEDLFSSQEIQGFLWGRVHIQTHSYNSGCLYQGFCSYWGLENLSQVFWFKGLEQCKF